ncbi:ribonuclease 3-like protein 3 [Durio zibethinus]|uniref:Ribonuclease 3-like protein 3 n=1 Tax=Durio zibethinus TaxID=66656 RepID=A0A6P6AMD0_DURZI|nr:ribonuclease 3-like protein 3 [Durio zibethinus]
MKKKISTHERLQLIARHITHPRSDNTENDKLARAAVNKGLHRFITKKTTIHDEQVMSNKPCEVQLSTDIYNIIMLKNVCKFNDGYLTFLSIKLTFGVSKIFLEMLGEHPASKLQDICQKNKLDLHMVKESWKTTYHLKRDIAVNKAAMEPVMMDLGIDYKNARDQKDEVVSFDVTLMSGVDINRNHL